MPLRHLVRRLRRAPGFTAVTLLTLALGIGANTAIFSVVRGVLLKPLPYPDPDRLVGVWQTAPGVGIKEVNASPATYFTYREETRAFQNIGLWVPDSVAITGVAEPERVDSLALTGATLPLLGIPPLRGRWFNLRDDAPGAPDTVILSYGYWQRRFGGDVSVLGRGLLIDGRPHEIVGIMPRSFRFLDLKPAIFVPLRFNRAQVFIGNFGYWSLARLKPGVTLAQASADVARMIPLMLLKFPPAPGMSADLFPKARFGPNLRPLKQDVVGDIGKVLWVVMGTVGIVLLIACANVANLVLVRAEARRHELAVRAALGAGRARIARELLSESLCLGVAGGALGLLVAYAALQLLLWLAPANLPRLDEISLDAPVLLFTLALSLFAGLLFGLMPVFKYAAASVAPVLREGGRHFTEGRRRLRARGALVVAQVALALVLLVASGLMIRTVLALRNVPPGFQSPRQILTLRIAVPDTQAPAPEQVLRTDEQIARNLAALPGVSAVGLSNSITMDGVTDHDPVYPQDQPASEQRLPKMRNNKFIGPGWFRAMGIPLLAGRDFTWADLYQGRHAVLISENLAHEFWGSPAAALGQRVRETPGAPWREVIGVVGNEHDDGVDRPAPTLVYWPLLIPNYWSRNTRIERTCAFTIRSPRAGTAALLQEVRQAVWSVNPNLPLADVRTVQQIYDRSLARTSFTLVMLSLAAAMALLLGIVGIYGVVSYSVSQRAREIGIRVALGATQAAISRMFLAHAFRLAAAGVALGLAAAFALTRLLSSLLYGIRPLDPLTFTAVPLLLAAVALLAAWLPARRALRACPALSR